MCQVSHVPCHVSTFIQKNIARIAKRCPSKFSSVVNMLKLFLLKMFTITTVTITTVTITTVTIKNFTKKMSLLLLLLLSHNPF